ncbi:MAG TPA: hypothetical protein VH110_03805 [Candidatus Acidoferrum sp.]|jgi:hypothetical protein|nr:hypothetical protein [Candidatus Acidoferrum sp.]
MNEFSIWMQSNWYAFGNLLAQFAFLIAGVWFARKILITTRASQEQFGALLKLTLSDELSERLKTGAATQRSTSTVAVDRPSPYVMAEWPPATEGPALTMPEEERGSRRLATAGRGLVQWLQTPMSSHGLVSWHKLARWLQTPAGN